MPRKEERKSLSMKALLKIAEGGLQFRRRYNVGLSDISSHGCRIVTQGIRLTAGERIVLKPEDLESISCTVRWATNEFAGVEFDHALHPAVVEHLCRLHPGKDQATLTLA